MQLEYTPIGAKLLWDRPGDLRHTSEKRPVKIEPQRNSLSTPFARMYLYLHPIGDMTCRTDYETILMDILPTFPMTQKGKTIYLTVLYPVKHFIDAKNRSSTSTLPYKLVSSPAHFKTLVTGRRKAIQVIVQHWTLSDVN